MPSVLTGLNTTVSITEGAAPLLLASGASLSGDGVYGAGAYLAIRGGAPGDAFGVQDTGSGPGQVSVLVNDVYYGGTLIGAISSVNGEYRITFNADVTSAAVEAVVQNLTYQNTSADPAAHHELFLNLFDMNGVDLGLTRGNDAYAIRTFTNNGTTTTDDGSQSTPFIWTFAGAPTLFSGTSTSGNMTLHQFSYTAGGGMVATSGGAGSIVANTGMTNLVYTRGNLYGDATDAIIAGGLDGSLRLFRHNPNAVQQPFTADVGDNSSPSLADIDGDGDLDLVVGAADGHLYYFANTGTAIDPVFEARTGVDNPFDSITVTGFSAPAFLDVDHDGDVDMVLGSADGTLRYFQNNGGAFTEQNGAANPFDGIDVGDRSAPFVFDLNGDGRLDLIVGRADGAYIVLESVDPSGVEIDVNITPVNSLPTAGASSALTIAEGANTFIFGSNMSFTDAETLQGELVYTLTNIPTGTVFRSGVALTVGGTFTYNDLQNSRVTFQHSGAEETVAHIGFTITDDDGGVLTGQTLDINITPVNDAPVSSGATGIAFDENVVNSAPQLFATGLTVSDAEGNFSGGKVVVGGLLAEDRVSVHDQGTGAGQIGVSGMTVSYGGVAIGVISVASDQTLTVTLNASATNAAVQALINNLEYANVSDSPTATRDLYVNVRDGTGADLVAPSFASPVLATAFPTGLAANASPELVDLDGDGDLDLLMGGADGFVSYYQNTGTATAPVFTLAATPTGITQDYGTFAELEAVDMDNDGDMDLFVSVAGTVRYYRNDGDATTPSFTLANTIASGNSGRGPVSTGDMDGDGDLDLLVGNGPGAMRYILNTGTATAPAFSLQGIGAGPAAFTSGTTLAHPMLFDLDGDGDLDLLMGATNGTITYRENIGTSGTAVFGAQQLAYFGTTPAGTISRLTSGDIDGDGDEDIILAVGNVGNSQTAFYVIENTSPRGVTITVTVNAEADTINGSAANDTLSGPGAGDVVNGLGGDDRLSGSAGTQTLNGGNGDDVLSGGAGNDVLDGGAGLDTADYSAAGAGVRAQLNGAVLANDGDGGLDTLISIENLTGSAFNDLLIGSNGNNILNGGLGADTLLGLDGDDILIGGAGAANQMQGGLGDDTYVVTANDTLIEFANEGTDTVITDRTSYLLKTHFENLTHTGASDFVGTGNSVANVMIGGSGRDILYGLAGDDRLSGGGGRDSLNGGQGVDTLDYSAAAAGVSVRMAVNATLDDGDGSTDSFSEMENVTGSAFNDLIFGDAGNNVLNGGLGADTLIGGDGNDTLIGGAGAANTLQGGLGDDTYVVTANDTITEFSGQGIDTVQTDRAYYALAANLENLTYTGSAAFTGTGNAEDNVITGGAGADTLIGGQGNDTLIGGGGIDYVVLSGVLADYAVTDLGGGSYRIVDSVGGRDGTDVTIDVERVRFSSGPTVTLASLAMALPAPLEPVDKTAGGPQVLPGLADDDFLIGKHVGTPEVLPGIDDLFGGLDGLSVDRAQGTAWLMLSETADGAIGHMPDASNGVWDHSGWNHDGFLF